MSGSAFLPRQCSVRIPADIAADEERDRIIAYADEEICKLAGMEAKLSGPEAAEVNLVRHRFAAFRDGIAGGLHR